MRSERLRWTGVLCAVSAAALTVLVRAQWQPLVSRDERTARVLHAWAVAHPGATQAVRVLSDWVWDPWTMRALAALAFVWLWRRGDRDRGLRVALAVLLAAVVQQTLKALVGRERPVWPDPVDSAHYAAYPSGHAMTATVVCGLLLWLLPRGSPGTPGGPAAPRPALSAAAVGAAWALAGVSVVGVGLTRLYLGVHWASDVVAGWLLGAAVVAFATGWRRGRLWP
ncbi:phosphatase PAP2 family protein [Streptomyces sp. cmx-4-9]|uniref:phosphatase PAP2 family protein n=1 Tax=Streptomyces sp. cmx-4-9 TaxID=2790941 RepID=UPI00397FF737